jgi:hypothetical protein
MIYTYCNDTVSDLHKDAYGIRPSIDFWTFWSTATDDQKQSTWNDLMKAADASWNEEQSRQILAEDDFERRILQLMSCGAKSREMAIEWLHQAYDTKGDNNYLEYCLGISYGYIAGEFPGVLPAA